MGSWLDSTRNQGTLVLGFGLVFLVLYVVGRIAGEDFDSYMGVAGFLAIVLGMVLRHYNQPDES